MFGQLIEVSTRFLNYGMAHKLRVGDDKGSVTTLCKPNLVWSLGFISSKVLLFGVDGTCLLGMNKIDSPNTSSGGEGNIEEDMILVGLFLLRGDDEQLITTSWNRIWKQFKIFWVVNT